MPKTSLMCAALLAAGALLPSCIINVDSRKERSGRYVGAETLSQVQAGKDQEYVLTLLGEPTRRSTTSSGVEIWSWKYRERKSSEGHLLFVFSTDDSTVTENCTYVEFQDGIVTKTWQD
jgi:outer membrane protein assembly factor BamE (lipoprotein component of BamABCDE complex)